MTTAATAASTATSWTAVCRIEDIPVLGARRVARERGLPVALFRTSVDQVFALLDRCPHKGGPLSQGIVAGEGVACPLHGWTIGFADGRARTPDEGATPTFACRVEAGRVMLDAAQLATHATDLEAPVAGPCMQTRGQTQGPAAKQATLPPAREPTARPVTLHR